MRLIEIKDKTQWESFLAECKEKTFLHSFAWGEHGRTLGDKIWRFGVFENGELAAAAQVFKIVSRRGIFLMVPHGPAEKSKIKNQKSKILQPLLTELIKLAEREKAAFIRIAPVWERNEVNNAIFRQLGFRAAPIFIHPEVTWELDITKPEQELLAGMRKTTRYLIRRGLKNQEIKITVSQQPEDLDIFYDLYQQTAAGQDFVPFSYNYLKAELEAFAPDEQVAILIARYRDEPIAGAIIVFWQGAVYYHHGASAKKYPQLPASYIVQWAAIREAKKRGCRTYNFWGIAEKNSKLQKSAHRFTGITLFKTGFGGCKKEYVKTQDLILSPRYWLNYIVETARRKKRHL